MTRNTIRRTAAALLSMLWMLALACAGESAPSTHTIAPAGTIAPTSTGPSAEGARVPASATSDAPIQAEEMARVVQPALDRTDGAHHRSIDDGLLAAAPPPSIAPPATAAVTIGPARRDRGVAMRAIGSASSMGGFAAAPPPPAAVLPTSGVLASTFVGGHGAASRLEDLMDRGVMVDGERVRLGAFDALGPLPYPVPAASAVALYADLERSILREDGEHVHMQIALVARNGERPVRPRMDVRLVIDRSGSMEGDKWTNAIAAAHALVDHLRPTDTFGLVSYAEVATLDRAPARVGNRADAHAAIRRLVAGGGTNIGDALSLVEANPPERHGANDVLLVMLLSDGQATIGTTDPDTLSSQARAMFDRAGIITTTLGVGTDFDENTMLSIAREGSGSYDFVRRPADIAPILTEELDERAMAVAQDLRLRIELSPGVSLARVYGSRVLDEAEAARVRATEVAVDARVARELGIPRDRQHDDDTGLRMHIPTFRRGDQHVVLLDLIVPPGAGDTEIAHVSLDFKDLRDQANGHSTVMIHADRTSDLERADASVRRPVKRTVLAFQAGDTLRNASEALAVGDSLRAAQLLDERIALLDAASRLWHDTSMMRDAHLLTSYRRAIGGAWQDWDSGSQHTLVLAMGYYGDQRME